MEPQRTFSLDKPRFDQSTFYGRFKHFASVTNPLLVFQSNKKIEFFKDLLEKYKKGTVPADVTDDVLWKAKNTLSAMYSRDGNKIPIPFRLTGYVMFNIPIGVGMMLPSGGIFQAAFWQLMNQSQNALMNHFNRSSDKELDTKMLIKSFTGAVATAFTILFGSDKLMHRFASPALLPNLKRILPFFAVSSANIMNTFLMRSHEVTTGINVQDSKGQIVGTSKIAAKKGIISTCLSRVFMSLVCVGLPPFIYPVFYKIHPIFKGKLNLPMQFSIVSATLLAIVPTMVSLFPQNMAVNPSILEPEFKEYIGKPLYFNKGL